MGVALVIGGDNLPFLAGIGLTDLPNAGKWFLTCNVLPVGTKLIVD